MNILQADQTLLTSLNLSTGLDPTSTKPALNLAWPLSDFTSLNSQISRPVATILRFLHYHILSTATTKTPTILIDLPPDSTSEPPELFFMQTVQKACALLNRTCTLDSSSTSYDLILSFFPIADEMHANHLHNLSLQFNGPIYILCGDCEALGMPISPDEEKERGLDSLRVEMLLKQILKPTRTSGASIAVEYARGGTDGKKAREENCALRRHQRNQLIGDTTLLLLSEKWAMFVMNDDNEEEDGNGEIGKSQESTNKVENDDTNKVIRFRQRLRTWYQKRLVLWDESDDELTIKLLQKHSTKDGYELFLRNAVETKWIVQTTKGIEKLWEDL